MLYDDYNDGEQEEIMHWCPYCHNQYYDHTYLAGPCPECANADGDWAEYAVNYLDTSPSNGVY